MDACVAFILNYYLWIYSQSPPGQARDAIRAKISAFTECDTCIPVLVLSCSPHHGRPFFHKSVLARELIQPVKKISAGFQLVYSYCIMNYKYFQVVMPNGHYSVMASSKLLVIRRVMHI